MKKSSLQPAAHAAAVAYRQDMARRGADDPFGAHDNGWLTVATLLAHAAAFVASEHDADALLLDASELAGWISVIRIPSGFAISTTVRTERSCVSPSASSNSAR
jgi:hypothetical protein